MNKQELLAIVKKLETLDIGEPEQFKMWDLYMEEIGKNFNYPLKFIAGNKFYQLSRREFTVHKADFVIR